MICHKSTDIQFVAKWWFEFKQVVSLVTIYLTESMVSVHIKVKYHHTNV